MKEEDKRNQQIKMQCVDYAVRILSETNYLKAEDKQKDVIEGATAFYKFIKDEVN